MSKIVYFCIPAYGHTNPTLAVVKELVSLGHEVYYYSFDEFKERIEEAGATFIRCDDYDLGMEESTDASDKVGKDIVFSTKLIVNATLAMDEKLTKEMEELKPDVIVGDSVAYWGKMIAKKLHIPFVSSTTTFAFNRYSSAIMKTSLKELIKMMFDMPKTKKLLAPLREKGYPADNILSIVQNDNETDTIVYTSKDFQPCSETFSDKYSFVGPLLRESKEEIKKSADKLIYISLGTVNNRHPDFYKNCMEALKDTTYQVILSVGAGTDLSSLGTIPSNMTAASSVDQMAVLKKADVFLSHCGMNSVNESLYLKVPLLMFPQTPEQEGVARRVEQLGAGIFLKDAGSGSIRNGLETVLNDPSYKTNAGKISDGFKMCGGAKEAAVAILNAVH